MQQMLTCAWDTSKPEQSFRRCRIQPVFDMSVLKEPKTAFRIFCSNCGVSFVVRIRISCREPGPDSDSLSFLFVFSSDSVLILLLFTNKFKLLELCHSCLAFQKSLMAPKFRYYWGKFALESFPSCAKYLLPHYTQLKPTPHVA